MVAHVGKYLTTRGSACVSDDLQHVPLQLCSIQITSELTAVTTKETDITISVSIDGTAISTGINFLDT